MPLKPDQIRRGVKVFGVSPKPHIERVGDVVATATDHVFFGVISEIEEGERPIVRVVITKPSIEQRMFEFTEVNCYADELSLNQDHEQRIQYIEPAEADHCDKCCKEKERVGPIYRLELPGGAGLFLDMRCWRDEMKWRKERNLELERFAQYPIVEWPGQKENKC